MNNLTDCKNVNPTIVDYKSISYEKVGYKNVFPKLSGKTTFSLIGFFLKKFQNFSIPHQLFEGKTLKQNKIGQISYPRFGPHFPVKA